MSRRTSVLDTRATPHHHRTGHFHWNPHFSPNARKQRRLARSFPPKSEIVAHQHGSRMQPFHQGMSHEFFRTQRRRIVRERQNQNLLDPHLVNVSDSAAPL